MDSLTSVRREDDLDLHVEGVLGQILDVHLRRKPSTQRMALLSAAQHPPAGSSDPRASDRERATMSAPLPWDVIQPLGCKETWRVRGSGGLRKVRACSQNRLGPHPCGKRSQPRSGGKPLCRSIIGGVGYAKLATQNRARRVRQDRAPPWCSPASPPSFPQRHTHLRMSPRGTLSEQNLRGTQRLVGACAIVSHDDRFPGGRRDQLPLGKARGRRWTWRT
jgi:hypothetical protein